MPPLRQRMSEDMQVRNFSINTQLSYLQQVSLFARYFGKSPDLLGREDVLISQVYLANEKQLAPGSIHTAISALRFLYKVTLERDWVPEEVLPLPKSHRSCRSSSVRMKGSGFSAACPFSRVRFWAGVRVLCTANGGRGSALTAAWHRAVPDELVSLEGTSMIRFAIKCLTIHCRNSEWHVFNRSPAISVLNGVFEEEPAERVLVEVLDVLARDVDIGAVIEVDPVHVVLGHLLDIDIQGFALDRI